MSDLPTSFCLSKLHALAHAQDENFITTSLAHVLVVYLETEEECAMRLLRYLYPKEFQMDSQLVSTMSVYTQYTTDFGVPDIVIKGADSILYIEAKVDSGFGEKQLERYAAALEGERESNKYLVTLTRYAVDNGSKATVRNLRWYELADEFASLHPNTDVGAYLKAEFLDLLKYRGITMETVSWELTEGVRSFRNLVDMIGEALRLRNVSIHQKSGAWDYYGYYIVEKRMFIGFYLNEPAVLVIETDKPIVIPDDYEPELGQIERGKWTYSIDLSSEDAHFFSRSRASQLQFLESWVGNAVKIGLALFDQDPK